MRNYIINSLLVSSFFLLALLNACSEDKEDVFMEISQITSIANLNTPITEASLGEFIAIHGPGMDMKKIDSICVNDVRVDMLEVYSENNTLFFPIPVKIAMEVTDKVYVYRKGDVVDFPLKVLLPEIRLDRMFNEYTKPGDTIMIYGGFFNLYEINAENGEVDFGGLKSEVITSSDTYLTTQVPLATGKNVEVKVRSLKYGKESKCPGRYRDEEFMIMNFDDAPYLSTKTEYVKTDPLDKNRLSGNYMMLTGEEAWDGWWYIAERGGITYPDDMLDNPDNYEVKCEFFTANQFIPGKIGFAIYTFWDAPPMKWLPENFIFQNFGRWETIRLPFTVERSTTYPENYRHTTFNIRLEIDKNIARHFAFDNIRICKKQ